MADKYWEKARKFANTMSKFEGDMGMFSSKLPALVENIMAHPDHKHFVYISFAVRERGGQGGIHGIYAVADALKTMGYKQFTLKNAQSFLKQKTNNPDLTLEPKKRFVLVTQKELGAGASSSKSQKAMMAAGENLKALVDIFNNSDTVIKMVI